MLWKVPVRQSWTVEFRIVPVRLGKLRFGSRGTVCSALDCFGMFKLGRAWQSRIVELWSVLFCRGVAVKDRQVP